MISLSSHLISCLFGESSNGDSQKCWFISFRHFCFIFIHVSFFLSLFMDTTNITRLSINCQPPPKYIHTEIMLDNKSQIYHSLSWLTSQPWPYQYFDWSQYANIATVLWPWNDEHKVRGEHIASDMEWQQRDDHSAGFTAIWNSCAFYRHSRSYVFRWVDIKSL